MRRIRSRAAATGATDRAARLFSGHSNDPSNSTLEGRYTAPLQYEAEYTTAASSAVAAGFLTPAATAAAIADADADFGNDQQPAVTSP